ncbi:hypothetical protein ACHAW5_004371 [Stephanodiscus triporus]|uniref:Sulfotransferase domain-containing protein n=1 Tax=Stephanodiscus triporus TaxID=2934178 RepID=A0ABD3Q4R4_9STRA
MKSSSGVAVGDNNANSLTYDGDGGNKDYYADKAGWFDEDASAEKYELEINDYVSLEGDDLVLDLLEGENVNDDGEEIFEGYLDDEIKNDEVGGEVDSDMDYDDQELPPEIIAPEGELPDYFVPLTPVERKELKDKLRSTLRATKSALLISANSDSIGSSNPSPQRTLVLDSNRPKQFMHMHHMKTGGTSLDGLIRCALQRQKDLHGGTEIKYNSMSECGSMVKTCMDKLAGNLNAKVVDNVFYQNDAQGQPQVDMKFSFDPADEAFDSTIDDLNVCSTSEAKVMSYCASLHAVRTFGWKGVDKITMIRNPVDRAWSMYRFTLDRCYKCQELKDVLRKIENGTFKGEEANFVYSPNDSCSVQMIGHQATNLLSSIDLYNAANDVRFPMEKQIVEEAVRNLREEITWIGLTDRMDESIRAIRDVFPFLAENISETVTALQDLFRKSGEQVGDNRFSVPEEYNDNKGCPMSHSNEGKEPHCGTKELDDETIYWIKKLNNRDVAVYKAAVERFTLQMEVLGEYRSGTL